MDNRTQETAELERESFQEETDRVDKLLAELMNEIKRQNIAPEKVEAVYKEVYGFRDEMVKDYGLGDKLFDNARKGLNDLGDFVQNTKDRVENTMHRYGDMLQEAAQDIKMRGEMALDMFMTKLRGFREQYHDYMIGRDRRTIDKLDKKIDDIHSRAQYRTNITAALKNVALAVKGKDIDTEKPEVTYTASEQAKIDHLNNAIKETISSIASKETKDIESRIEHSGSQELKSTLYNLQLTEIAKNAGHDIVAGYLVGDDVIPPEKTDPDIKAQQKPVIISMDGNKNIHLSEYMGSGLMSTVIEMYETESQEKYRTERNADIENNVEGCLENTSVEEMTSLAQQIDREDEQEQNADSIIARFAEEYPAVAEKLGVDALSVENEHIVVNGIHEDTDQTWECPVAYINSDGSFVPDKEEIERLTGEEMDVDKQEEPEELEWSENEDYEIC